MGLDSTGPVFVLNSIAVLCKTDEIHLNSHMHGDPNVLTYMRCVRGESHQLICKHAVWKLEVCWMKTGLTICQTKKDLNCTDNQENTLFRNGPLEDSGTGLGLGKCN